MKDKFKVWFDEHMDALNYLLSEYSRINFTFRGTPTREDLVVLLTTEINDRLKGVRELGHIDPVLHATSAATLARSVFESGVWLRTLSLPQETDAKREEQNQVTAEYLMTAVYFARKGRKNAKFPPADDELAEQWTRQENYLIERLRGFLPANAIEERKQRDQPWPFPERLRRCWDLSPNSDENKRNLFSANYKALYDGLTQAVHVTYPTLRRHMARLGDFTVAAELWAMTFRACGWGLHSVSTSRLLATNPADVHGDGEKQLVAHKRLIKCENPFDQSSA